MSLFLPNLSKGSFVIILFNSLDLEASKRTMEKNFLLSDLKVNPLVELCVLITEMIIRILKLQLVLIESYFSTFEPSRRTLSLKLNSKN